MSGSGGSGKPPPAAAAASELHPDIMVQYLRSLGVTVETTRAIRAEVIDTMLSARAFTVVLRWALLLWFVNCEL